MLFAEGGVGAPHLTLTLYPAHNITWHLQCRAAANCADLQAAGEATGFGDVLGELLTTEISCSEWTNINIVNKLKLVGTEDGTTTFNNVRFVVSSGALRMEVPAELTGDAPMQVQVGAGRRTKIGRVYVCSV